MACKNSTLTDKGFTQCSSCNCGGVFSEKWSGYLDYRLRIVARNKFYLYKSNRLLKQGAIAELNATLNNLNDEPHKNNASPIPKGT